MKMQAKQFRTFLSNINEGAQLNEKERVGADLSKIMRKVAKEKNLTKFERNTLAAAVDASKENESNTDRKMELEGIMSKISQGYNLDRRERQVLSAALRGGVG